MKDAHVYSNYREAVIGAVADLANEHPEIVFLDADLSSCIGSTSFQKESPIDSSTAALQRLIWPESQQDFHQWDLSHSSTHSDALHPAAITISSSSLSDMRISVSLS